MLNTDDLRHYTGIGTGYSPEMMMQRAADEIDRLRECAGSVVAAFEALGRPNAVAEVLVARARCESVMLELQHVLKGN